MSEFQLDKGEELLECLLEIIGSEEGVKQWVREFAEWVELCYDDGDPDYENVEDSLSESTEESSEEEPLSITVEETYETEIDEDGFHQIKDVALDDEKKNISN